LDLNNLWLCAIPVKIAYASLKLRRGVDLNSTYEMQPGILKECFEDGGLTLPASGDGMSVAFPDDAGFFIPRKALRQPVDMVVYARGCNRRKAGHPAALSRGLGSLAKQQVRA
jgi:hypothetical protein